MNRIVTGICLICSREPEAGHYLLPDDAAHDPEGAVKAPSPRGKAAGKEFMKRYGKPYLKGGFSNWKNK